ncbi:hypothetical protein DID75_02205 [Candidatus Marinamargulisbacteria bacterium SCGC AG-410-N11]|nr:hypothetical protein DID75_02205 [Candidatus Marinamargulisbacteria bacterium SCGC AG-410-N11]
MGNQKSVWNKSILILFILFTLAGCGKNMFGTKEFTSTDPNELLTEASTVEDYKKVTEITTQQLRSLETDYKTLIEEVKTDPAKKDTVEYKQYEAKKSEIAVQMAKAKMGEMEIDTFELASKTMSLTENSNKEDASNIFTELSSVGNENATTANLIETANLAGYSINNYQEGMNFLSAIVNNQSLQNQVGVTINIYNKMSNNELIAAGTLCTTTVTKLVNAYMIVNIDSVEVRDKTKELLDELIEFADAKAKEDNYDVKQLSIYEIAENAIIAFEITDNFSKDQLDQLKEVYVDMNNLKKVTDALKTLKQQEAGEVTVTLTDKTTKTFKYSWLNEDESSTDATPVVKQDNKKSRMTVEIEAFLKEIFTK